MLKSNLLEILATLNLKEFKDFGEYVNSPFFNKNEAVIKLYEYIRRYFPALEGLNFGKENVFSEIFPNAEYNDGFMRTIMFNLTKLAEDYIAYKDFKSRELTEQIHLLKALNKRDLNRLFSKNLKLASEKLEKNRIHDEFYFNEKFLIEYEKNINDFKSIKILNQKDIPEGGIANQSEYLINYFILQLLKRYRTLLNLKNVLDIDFGRPLMAELLQYIESHPEIYTEIPLAGLLYNEIKLLETDDKDYYNSIKELVLDMNTGFDRSERFNGLVVISNYCLKKNHEGNRSALEDFMEISEFMFENKIDTLNKGDYLQINYFRTVLLMALTAGRVDWAERFVKESKDALSPEERENAYNFAMARLEFSRRNFERSLKFLSLVRYDDIYYKFSGKTLQAQLYYELDMLNELSDHLDSYRKFLNNSKLLTGLHKKVNENFVKVMNDLLKLKSNSGRTKISKLKEKITTYKELSGKSWLLNKLEELEKS